MDWPLDVIFPCVGLPTARASLPSGLLISSSEDMAHYLIAHLIGGRYGYVQILSEVGIDELHRGVSEYKDRALDILAGWLWTPIEDESSDLA